MEILKALYFGADTIILDEPTAVLTPQETDELFKTIRVLVGDGKTVIFITHQIDEAVFLADRLMIMSARPGRVQEIIPIEIERPRSLEIKRDPRFVEVADYVWHSIERQVRAAIKEEQQTIVGRRVAEEVGRE